jgi:hypothetical protein
MGGGVDNLTYSQNKFYKKIYKIVNGTIAQATIFTFGDSVAGFGSTTISRNLKDTFGVVGYAGSQIGDGTSSLGGISMDSSTGTVTTVSSYAYWAIGSHRELSANATATFGASGSAMTGTKFTAYLAKGVGLGTALVELVDNAGVVQTTVGTFNLSNATPDLQIATVTVGAVVARRIKITAVSGVVPVLTCGYVNTLVSGVCLVQLSVGGLSLVNALSAPAAILTKFYQDIAPDLTTYHMREGNATLINDTSNGLNVLLSRFDAGWTGSDYLFIAPTAGVIDAGLSKVNAPSFQEGQAIKNIAESRNNMFLDSFSVLGSYEDILSRDNAYDGNHVNATEREQLGAQIGKIVGLTSMPNYPQASVVSNNLVKTASLVVRKLEGQTVASKFESDNFGFDGYLRTNRWMQITDMSGAVGLFVSPAWSGGSGVIIGYGNPSFSGDISRYAVNGHVNQTTGKTTFYSRVNNNLSTNTIPLIPSTPPSVTGSKSSGAALTSLLSTLATLGIITDATTT